jgi:hypothetical protein
MNTFNKIDFSEEKKELIDGLSEEGKEEEVERQFNQEALDTIWKEMEKIRFGSSKLTPYAIQNSGLAVIHCFNQLKSDFDSKRVEIFLEISAQDYGKAAADRFEKWLTEGIEE